MILIDTNVRLAMMRAVAMTKPGVARASGFPTGERMPSPPLSTNFASG